MVFIIATFVSCVAVTKHQYDEDRKDADRELLDTPPAEGGRKEEHQRLGMRVVKSTSTDNLPRVVVDDESGADGDGNQQEQNSDDERCEGTAIAGAPDPITNAGKNRNSAGGWSEPVEK